MLFLKSLPANRLAYNKFLWPDQVGVIIESTTWDPRPECGGGLHGLIEGQGDTNLLCDDDDAVWYAFESVDENGNPSDAEAIAIDYEKGKCHRAIIRAVGTLNEATTWLVQAGCRRIPYATIIADDSSGVYLGKDSATITGRDSAIVVGDCGQVITGNHSNVMTDHNAEVIADHNATLNLGLSAYAIARTYAEITANIGSKIITSRRGEIAARHNAVIIAGEGSHITATDHSTAFAGGYSVVELGDYAHCISDQESKATGHDNSTILTGRRGYATAGSRSTAISGDYGKATAGNNSIVIAGYWGTVSGGHNSVLVLGHSYTDTLDGTDCREPRVAIVGKNGIKPNTPYRLDDEGNFVEVVPF